MRATSYTKGATLKLFGAGALFFALLFQAGSSARAVDSTSKMSKKELHSLIAKAKTAQDHEMLAAYYRQKADQANATVAEHEQMLTGYRENPFSSYAAHRTAMKTGSTPEVYCDNLIRIYGEEAKQYTALAEYHQKLAKHPGR
jgi:hypothetical protein